jgi:hypothetical protein
VLRCHPLQLQVKESAVQRLQAELVAVERQCADLEYGTRDVP